MKEKIWIEKLIELLWEYEDVNNWYATYTIRGEKSERELKSSYMFDEDQDIIQIYIISKSYWFIKWLVENDKIDNKKIADETYVKVNWEWYELILGCHYDLYQQTLMLLAIQDEPIEFLISILK